MTQPAPESGTEGALRTALEDVRENSGNDTADVLLPRLMKAVRGYLESPHHHRRDVLHFQMLEALKKARQFIANGVELGYIRMPEASTPDPAHDTLPAIEAALSAAQVRP